MAYLKTVSLADGERICWHVANTIQAQLHYLDERDGVALKALLRKCCDLSYQFMDLPTYGNPRAALQTPRFFDAQRNLKAFINDKDEVDALVKK